MTLREFSELEEAAEGLPKSTIEAVTRAMRAGRDPLRSVLLARWLNALSMVMAENVSGLEDAASAPSDWAALLRVLERPEALAALAAEDPLAAARLLGIEARARLLEEVGAAELGKMLGGISAQAVDKRRRAGKLLALPVGKNRYPVWQVEGGEVLAGFEKVLGAFSVEDPWTRASFILGGNARLGGARPLDKLREGGVGAVREAASTYGEQLAD